jgi:RNA polymerase sigma-70 factor, ECF subfamily
MEVAMGVLAATLPHVDPAMDPESRAWVAALAGDGGDREAALDRLHALLLRAASFELRRRRGQLAGLSAAERNDLAVQAADDAMMGVLARLGDFRGLRAHLAGCQACREEHESLRALLADDPG